MFALFVLSLPCETPDRAQETHKVKITFSTFHAPSRSTSLLYLNLHATSAFKCLPKPLSAYSPPSHHHVLVPKALMTSLVFLEAVRNARQQQSIHCYWLTIFLFLFILHQHQVRSLCVLPIEIQSVWLLAHHLLSPVIARHQITCQCVHKTSLLPSSFINIKLICISQCPSRFRTLAHQVEHHLLPAIANSLPALPQMVKTRGRCS